jgi:hypothetical protein
MKQVIIAHQTELAAALMASFHDCFPFSSLAEDLSPNQQPDYATDQADGGKGHDNP